MSRSETCTVNLSYNGARYGISFPENTPYEDFIKMAMEVFKIPSEAVDLVKITSGEQYIFTKEAFENYLMLYPEPEITLKVILCNSVEDFTMGPPRWQRMYTGSSGPQLNGQWFNNYY